MSISQDYISYICDQLADTGMVVSKKMFGGAGLYLDGKVIGLISENILYFKVDDTNKADYLDADMKPFRPFGDESYAMNYYELPAEVLEDKTKLAEWAKKAFEVSCKTPAKKKSTRKTQNAS